MTSMTLIEPIGFCHGVQRAIAKARHLKASVPGKVYTDGPLVHNPEVLRSLEQEGIFAQEISKSWIAPEGSGLLIRAHGIHPERKRWLQALCGQHCPFVDATCPKVARIGNIMERYSRQGAHILLLGDEKHPEVLGLQGFAQTAYTVLKNLEHVRRFCTSQTSSELQNPYVLVAQSTFDADEFRQASAYLQQNLENFLAFNTLCSATQERKKALLMALQRGVDAVIVVGGKFSANTQGLAATAHAHEVPAWIIEKPKEMTSSDLKSYQKLAICAGTSTSAETVKTLQKFLEQHLGLKSQH